MMTMSGSIWQAGTVFRVERSLALSWVVEISVPELSSTSWCQGGGVLHRKAPLSSLPRRVCFTVQGLGNPGHL